MTNVGTTSSHSGGLELLLEKQPKASFFTGLKKFDLRARVCRQCGYVQFFVQNRQGLGEFPKEQSG
jgi:hypothetical protein